ncbi:MAG: sugar ABC transporter substrate-binding protein [Actinomycetota bacterium]
MVAFAFIACTVVAAPAGASPARHAKLSSILFVNPLPNYPAWKAGGQCMRARAKQVGIPYTETGPAGNALDPTAMIQQVQQGIANKVGAIITFPATDGFAPVLSQARKAGIVVGTLYGAPASAATGSDVNVGADFTQEGQVFEQAIAKRPGQQIVGLMAQGPTGAATLGWQNGFKAAAKKSKNVKVVATVYTGDDTSKALAQANALLTAHPEINVIASHMGTATAGATAAIKAKHLVGKVVFVGNGAANGGIAGLADHTIYKFLVQDGCGAVKKIIDAVETVSEGKKVPAQINVGLKMVGSSDYKLYLKKGWQ